MNRVTIIFVRGLVLAALLFAGYNLPAQTASNSTPVCNSLIGNTTWSLVNSPYDVCGAGVTVPPGVTLTIDPGVTVQFNTEAGNRKLTVQGALVASGTVTQTITLTGATASPGSWGGIRAEGTAILPAQVDLDYVALDYGGVSGSDGAQVYADQAVVTITHSLIRNSAGNGVYISLSSHFDAHTTDFVDNGQNAIQLNQPSTDLLMTGLTASGNGTDGVRVAGGSVWHGQRRWASPGIPYIVDGPVRTDQGDVLKIDPGNTLQFTPTGWLYIRGRLEALGTPSEPITLTAQTQTPGGWSGLFIDGVTRDAVAQLDYVTIEYAGSGIHGANIEVANGRLVVHHSIIRHSDKDGVRFDNNWGGSILESQIISNGLYGVVNSTPNRPVLATNNWWGDAGGPQSDVAACPQGNGAKVSAGVLYSPVLTSTLTSASFPLSAVPILTLTPQRWFAPANGVTKIYFDITLRDGNGAPMPGRTVGLASTLGTAIGGGTTDPNGKTLAYLTSTSVGDAVVTATLVPVSDCDGALSPETKVTFTTPVNVTDLLPNAPASYFDGDIEISPLPVVTGISTTMTIKLTNPLPQAITVNVSFGFAQSGIGLVFGPIKDIFDQVIPGNSSVSLSAAFLPVVSGHYCVQVTYEITAIGQARVLQPADTKTSRNRNLNVFQGSMGSPSSKDALNKADNAFKTVSKIPSGPTRIQKGILGAWWGTMKETASDISKALGFDPPRQDYNQVTMPVRHPIPAVQPDANISMDRAAALNAVNAALTEIEAFGRAATIAMDRYGGASEANDLQWASEQANELLYYNEQLGSALLGYADRLDAFVQVLQSEGETEITVTVSDITSYQQRLMAQGFTDQEIDNAKLIGWTDADIEAYRLAIIAANPNDSAGNLLTMYSNEASVCRDLGNALLHPQNFNSSISVSGGAGMRPNAAGNIMAQVYNSVSTIQLANPSLAQTALIDVSARRINLPADWSVDVSPTQITLAPGEQITVTVSVIAGSPVPQGSTPRIAVEGYTGSQLLGGVVIDIMVPNYMPFDGNLHIYLPVLEK